ncbi:MAG: hypothetical protein COC01_00560 [Bacteroidetes bacterium]|nr:hypothetical protein [Bacteroidia bacterium]PCH69826.1 MAG: hypothetical protein COC01_00560 [Bacteroidota bacterium]
MSLNFKKISIVGLIFFWSCSAIIAQRLDERQLFGSASLGTGAKYGIIGLNTEMGYHRFGLNFGLGKGVRAKVAVVGGFNFYYYFIRNYPLFRGRTGLHFGTIEREGDITVGPFVATGFEYWFRNYLTFNIDFSVPFVKDYYAVSPSLGVGYNITSNLQNSKVLRGAKREDKKASKKPKPTF